MCFVPGLNGSVVTTLPDSTRLSEPGLVYFTVEMRDDGKETRPGHAKPGLKLKTRS